MQRNVYLQGELGDRFGHKFSVHSNNTADILRCIYANRPEFKPFLVDCSHKQIALHVQYQEQDICEEDMLTPLKEGDVTISLIPEGSKKAVGKILAAVAIIYFGLPMIADKFAASAVAKAGGAAATTGAKISAALGTWQGQVAFAVATNLAMVGIQELMAQDPDTDNSAPDNYLFSGQANNSVDGDPVPVLYGELRVPGRPVAVDVIKGVYQNPMSVIEADGGMSAARLDNLEEKI